MVKEAIKADKALGFVGKMRSMTRAKNLRSTWRALFVVIIVSFDNEKVAPMIFRFPYFEHWI